MRLLLDTHIALWAISNYDRLSSRALALIRDPGNEIWISSASILEISIKHAQNRTGPTAVAISGFKAIELFSEAGYQLLDVRASHAAAVGPLPRHHGDPFDRLLIAQAQSESIALVTHDPIVARYSDSIIRV